MCGRAYRLFTGEALNERFARLEGWAPPTLDLKPAYNIAPTALTPVVFKDQGQFKCEWMRFGLVPAWAKTLKDAAKYSLINARIEEVESKRTYAKPFQSQRCIIPLSGFYEWKLNPDQSKTPYEIHLKNEPVFCAAGIFERWRSEDGSNLLSFSMLTTAANSFMKDIHDRMPVILEKGQFADWLNADLTDVQKIKQLVTATSDDVLQAHEISKLVNSVKNQGPEVLNR